jgi:hypothetical protein
MNDAALAARRRELAERCAEQRVGLAYELEALRQPAGRVSRLLAHRRLALGAAGVAAGLALIRPARMQGLARAAVSGWRIAQHGLALLARYRR